MCDTSRVDHAYIEEGKRFSDFKLLAMDMDSTLITIECIDELADYAGKKKEVAAITEAAMRGEIPDFAESLRRRVALLRGLPIDALEAVYRERLRLNEGARELVGIARKNGIFTAMLSGGFDFFADRVKTVLGIDYACANRLSIHDGLIVGTLNGPTVDGPGKANSVRHLTSELKATKFEVIAIGDGANDLEMMQEAGLSIAFHGNQVVRDRATSAVRFGPLTTILDWLT